MMIHKLKLEKIAVKLRKDVLNLKKRDRVVIITNPKRDVLQISTSLFKTFLGATDKVQLLVQPEKSSMDFAEDYVIHAIEEKPDVIVSISSNRLGKDRFRVKNPIKYKGKVYTHIFDYLLFAKKAFRGFWSPGITLDIFLRAADVDYKKLREVCRKVKKSFRNVDKIRVTSKQGTDITFSIRDRKVWVDDGDFRKPGNAGNIPCGEVFMSPTIGSAEGRIVFDGSLSYSKGSIVLKEPVVVEFKNGYVSKIKGGKEAKLFIREIRNGVKKALKEIKDKKVAKEYAKNAKHLGEFGIGLNPKAKIVGNVLEDEKVMKTVHFAIGANYDQDAKALIHYDGLVLRPTVEVDGEVVMKDGNLLI